MCGAAASCAASLADEVFQGWAEPGWVAGQPVAEELQRFCEFGRVRADTIAPSCGTGREQLSNPVDLM